MTDELEPLPCPFCGGEPEGMGRSGPTFRDGEVRYVVCRGCLASTGPYGARGSAIVAWNRRPNHNSSQVRMTEVLLRAKSKLQAYNRQTGGIYSEGEALQFLMNDIDAALVATSPIPTEVK